MQQKQSEIMMQVEQLLNQIPDTKEMLSASGMGITTLARFLAEVSGVQGYDHRQQILRLAGHNLKENSSGTRKGVLAWVPTHLIKARHLHMITERAIKPRASALGN